MIPLRCIAKSSAAVSLILLTGCSLAPDYQRPDIAIAENYKEAAGDWLQAAPECANTERGPWWKMYGDSDLDALEDTLTKANQDLKAALARYDEARASANIARAGYFPAITANGDASRQRLSHNIATSSPKSQYNDYLAGADLSYELDLWGRVRNAVQSGESRADASAADMAAMDLSLHAELALDYFSLRAAEATQKVADETVIAYQKALELTQARHTGGAAAEVDVDQAQTQLANAQTLAADTHLNRSQLEHAIAVLVGETPSSFTLEVKETNVAIPPAVPGLPSKLLEQRPDIAAAALRVQAANADIGVARAAYFPDFIFSAAGGFESALASKLLNAPSLFWSIGPSVTLPIFDGGKINALNDQAKAAYDESVANYRQTVLVAFQEVEDNLAALRQLAQETKTQDIAVASADRALKQAQNRYTGGIATYLDVVVAQNTALQTELNAITLRTRSITASVLLVKALGGGWIEPLTMDDPEFVLDTEY